MLILRNPESIHESINSIPDPDIRRLIQNRFIEISDGLSGEPFDPDLHGYLILVEPGDTVAALEEESHCNIMRNIFNDTQFGHPYFSPTFEFLEEYEVCYEMVFILSDSGYGIDFFIPKQEGIDAELLAFCARYATPPYATTHAQPQY